VECVNCASNTNEHITFLNRLLYSTRAYAAVLKMVETPLHEDRESSVGKGALSKLHSVLKSNGELLLKHWHSFSQLSDECGPSGIIISEKSAVF